MATAMLDVSDGLDDDLCAAARCQWRRCRTGRRRAAAQRGAARDGPGRSAVECALTGGDDYELCFTVPPSDEPALARAGGRLVRAGNAHRHRRRRSLARAGCLMAGH